MPAYHRTFPDSATVRILDYESLKSACGARPPWPHLTDDQIPFAGVDAHITSTQYFHGGRVLHELRTVDRCHLPGVWPEEFLEDAALLMSGSWGYPRPSDYFTIESVSRVGHDYVVVSDPAGVDCLTIRSLDSSQLAEAMQYVATQLHFTTFETRYGFSSPFDWWKETQFLAFWEETIHLAVINEIAWTENELEVQLSGKDGSVYRAHFLNVTHVEQHNPRGMCVYFIAECGDSSGSHCYRFVNADPLDTSHLNVFAPQATLEVVGKES